MWKSCERLLNCCLMANSPFLLVCPRVVPGSLPKPRAQGTAKQLTPVITAQSDTITRRSRTETCVAPLMVTWSEGKTLSTPLPLASSCWLSLVPPARKAWLSGPLPPPRFIWSDPGCLWMPVSSLPFPITSVLQMISDMKMRPESLMT